jgi:Flp pilus assembly protein TadD
MPQHGWTDEDVFLVAERAFSLYQQGCCREAAVLLEGLTVVDPKNAYCHDALAAAYLALGEPQQAVLAASTALRLQPNHTEARSRRCEAFVRLRRFEEARQDLEAFRQARAMVHVRRMQARLRAANALGATIR